MAENNLIVPSELMKYIHDCRQEGFGDQEIADRLLSTGWSAQQVVDAFNAVVGVGVFTPLTPRDENA